MAIRFQVTFEPWFTLLLVASESVSFIALWRQLSGLQQAKMDPSYPFASCWAFVQCWTKVNDRM